MNHDCKDHSHEEPKHGQSGPKGEQQHVVMMPPYVAEEHRDLLDTAYRQLEEYQQYLILRLQQELDYGVGNIQPHPESLMAMERAFREDPVRQQLIKHLCYVRMLVERPRFMVKAS